MPSTAKSNDKGFFLSWPGQFSGCQGLGGAENGSDCLMGTRFPFWGDENVLEPDSGDSCPTLNVLNAMELHTSKWLECQSSA